MSAVKIQAKGFKQAWGESLYGGPHNLKTLAGESGISATTLAATADEEKPADMISMRRFLELYPHCENLAVLDWMEARVGRVAFRVPEADACTTRACADFMRSAAALLDKKAQALDDRVMQADEAAEIQRLVAEVMRKAAAIAKRAEQLVASAEAA